jgi:hypothetical protein
MTDLGSIPDLSALPAALNQVDDAVKAAGNVLQDVANLLPDETRNIVVEINNLTGLTLQLVTDNFAHGGFGPQLPHALIGPGDTEVFGTKSTGVATGVEGSVTYKADGIDGLLLGFDNPFIGSNSVNVTLNGPLAPALSCIGDIASGNHTVARFELFFQNDFSVGDTIILLCQGTVPGSRYLDGRTGNGTVGLAPQTTGSFTGTKWKVHDGGNGSFILECLGTLPGNRFLDGRTADGSVGLAPSTDGVFTGTRWQFTKIDALSYTIKCLGNVEGPRFLNGITGNGTINLAPNTDSPFSGTRWVTLHL